MRSPLRGLLGGVCAACILAAASGGRAAPPTARATVLREHPIHDPGMGNQVAVRVLVPEGWTVEGGMTRPSPQFYSTAVLLDVKFKAPDGRQVRQFPSLNFEFDNRQPQPMFSPTMQGNMTMPLFPSPGAWLMEMIRLRPDPAVKNPRLVSQRMDLESTRKLREQNAALYRMIEQGRPMAMHTGMDMQFDAQATLLVLQYTEGGKALEETVAVSWQALVHTWQGQVTHGTWSITGMHSLRGPVGTRYVDDPELLAVLRSGRPDPVWAQEMSKHWAEMARIRSQGAVQRQNQAFAAHQKRMQTLSETGDILFQTWKSQSAASDASHARRIDQIHEVTPYQVPGGGTVKLPSFYDHVFSDGQGRYLLSNDALYQPGTDPTVNQSDWQRIEPQR